MNQTSDSALTKLNLNGVFSSVGEFVEDLVFVSVLGDVDVDVTEANKKSL